MGSSSIPSTTLEPDQTNNKQDHKELVTISEKVSLTKNQYEVLNVICNIHNESISHYMQEALVEAMRFDIEEGNFSDVLLQKIKYKKEEEKKRAPSKEDSTGSFLRDSSVDEGIGTVYNFRLPLPNRLPEPKSDGNLFLSLNIFNIGSPSTFS
jgi:hypothetical protein